MPRYALKVAYDGTRFQGSQRQPTYRTVEGELIRVLTRLGAIANAEDARFLAASRTDAGVSAAGNVFAVTTRMPAQAIQRALNDYLDGAWVLAVAEVPEDFHPRKSRRRRYRYHLRRGSFDEARFREAVALFQGTHDFTGFARVEPGVDPVRTVDEVAVHEADPFLNVEFTAPNYLWNQVRRMVGAGLAVARGEATLDEVRAILARRLTRDLGTAPPEPLVLLDVEYDFPLAPDPAVARAILAPARDALALRAAVLDDIAPPGEGP